MLCGYEGYIELYEGYIELLVFKHLEFIIQLQIVCRTTDCPITGFTNRSEWPYRIP